MRRNLSVLALVALFAGAASVQAQESGSGQGQNQAAQNSSSSASASSSTSSSSSQSASKTDSLAEAARKARAAKQESPKPAKVFTNDNIPTAGGISAVGETSSSDAPASGDNSASSAGPASSGSAFPDGNDEKDWRALFANLQHKLQQDQQLLDVSQRELGVLSVQYYNDPTKALMQQYSRSDIDKKTAAIEQMKKDVDADKQAISDAQDALRRAGGDPGWAE